MVVASSSSFTDYQLHRLFFPLPMLIRNTPHHYSLSKYLAVFSAQSVIKSAITASIRPLPINPKSGVYLMMTPSDVYVQDFCNNVFGFHYFTFPSIVGYTRSYAWVGNSANLFPGVCAYPFAMPAYIPTLKVVKPLNDDVGVDGMISPFQ
ncbi:protein EXORDIUM-like 3 [Henckelia pumila]|uniref:protein EXORDIUM-like 3 n=1 Tax=Henckelia pumila TaxID=405737 RepID=UPI003C6E9D4D